MLEIKPLLFPQPKTPKIPTHKLIVLEMKPICCTTQNPATPVY
jgi:hypothetical protein